MKIGKAKPPGIAGYAPPRKNGEPKPEGYKMGRPTNYRPEYCQSVVEYFSAAESWNQRTSDKGTAQILPVSKLPTFERWAAGIGVSIETCDRWRANNPEFMEAWTIAKSLQKAFLMELGAAGVGNHVLALMLRTNHGMKDEPEDKNDKPVEIRIVNATRPADAE